LALLVFSGALSFAISPRPSFARNSASSQAQSSDDPNRPPYAQTPRRAPQHVQAASMPQPSAPQPSAPQPSTNAPSGDERILFDHVNESRVLAGLHPLQWDANLAAAARRHCLLLVQHEALSHQFPGEADLKIRLRQNGVEFSVAAENVAVAGTPDELHYAWMHSPPHRANILDPDLNAIGIAELPGSKGLYATQDFAQALESLSLAEQEQQIRSLLSAAGLRTADNAERTQWSDARRTCQMPSGYAGKPAAFVKFDSADLRQLPAKLRTLLAGGKYRSAAVGACDPIGSSDGFSQYRLAVLLYP
jgi:uncharacterized protein YkwD